LAFVANASASLHGLAAALAQRSGVVLICAHSSHLTIIRISSTIAPPTISPISIALLPESQSQRPRA
jgi:hypothetical protein